MSGSDIAMVGGIGAAGSVIAAPYVLPMLGIGAGRVDQMLQICSNSAGELGSGLVGTLNGGLSAIPVVGESLAAGGWGTALTSGIIGLGGVFLGDYIEKHYDKEGQIPWGTIIKYAAITTSILIALPSILSGISMGLTFLGLAIGGAEMGGAIGTAMGGSLGFMGGMQPLTSAAGIAGLLPHFFTCVLGALPVVGTLLTSQKMAHETPSNQLQEVDFLERLQRAKEAAVSA